MRARIRDGGDGATLLEGWYDRELDTPCNFMPAKDGRTRCLPYVEAARAHETTADILYMDGACTLPVRVFSKDLSTVPKLVVSEPSVDSCDGTQKDFSVLEVGDETFPVTSLYYPIDGQCGGLADPTNLRVFTLGSEVPLNRFVGAESAIEADEGARLGAITLKADDGAREVIGVEDVAKGEECVSGIWGLDQGPCIPRKIAWSIGFFADAACTQPTAYVSSYSPGGSDPQCAQPEIIVSFRYDDCTGDTMELHELGALADAGYRSIRGGPCEAAPDSAGHANFSFGAKLPYSSFGQVHPTRVGTGRLKAEYDATGSRILAGKGLFYDSFTGESCDQLTFCDGTTRCVATTALYERGYADNACTKPIVAIFRSPCGGPAPTAPVQVDPEGGSADCGVTEGEIVEIGPETEAPAILFQKTAGACGEYGPPSSTDVTWHELGLAVPASTFPTVVKRTE